LRRPAGLPAVRAAARLTAVRRPRRLPAMPRAEWLAVVAAERMAVVVAVRLLVTERPIAVAIMIAMPVVMRTVLEMVRLVRRMMHLVKITVVGAHRVNFTPRVPGMSAASALGEGGRGVQRQGQTRYECRGPHGTSAQLHRNLHKVRHG
jgi:hypothetical protein